MRAFLFCCSFLENNHKVMEFKKHCGLSPAEDKDSSHHSQQLKFENVVGNNLQVKGVSARCLMTAPRDLASADLEHQGRWRGHRRPRECGSGGHPAVSPLRFAPTPPPCPPAHVSVLGRIHHIGGAAEPGAVSLGRQTRRSGTCCTKVTPRGRTCAKRKPGWSRAGDEHRDARERGVRLWPRRRRRGVRAGGSCSCLS